MSCENLGDKAYEYGYFYEKRKRTPATDKHYRTYEAMMMHLWQELKACGAIDEDGKLKPIQY